MAVALAATAAHAAITWVATGSIDVGTVAPPVKFEAGSGASNPRHLQSFSISTNATAFSGVVKGKSGADFTVKDVVRIVNLRGTGQAVSFAADQVTDPYVEAFWWRVKDGGTTIATLDYRAPSPSTTFSLPAGATYKMDLRVDLKDGAKGASVSVPFVLRTVVT